MNRTFKKLAAIAIVLAALTVLISPTSNAEMPPAIPVARACEMEVIPAKAATRGLWMGLFPREVKELVEVTSEEVEVIEESPDRTKPIYEVYKNGWFVSAASADIQWIIRDLCEQYDLPEKAIYGLILVESTFDTNCVSQTGRHLGLAQIGRFWITEANMPHFTDDYRSRDLFDPYDNLLTLAEMMCFARGEYNLDYSQRGDLVKYLYWHNTGQNPTRVTNWDYATNALRFGDELVAL